MRSEGTRTGSRAAGCGQGRHRVQAHRTGKEPAGTRAENEDEGTRTGKQGAAGLRPGAGTGTVQAHRTGTVQAHRTGKRLVRTRAEDEGCGCKHWKQGLSLNSCASCSDQIST